ncbi:YEATS domain-containing protein 4 [Galendromus occidentalis]|uniref:YEATS domain-containing protein 4 n=1 Tax=Galendromus occidentalis TaxID=34638 RepID=A0AAJ6QYP1_9ACAR|nr:YEATS domain-containing protein 4 [Galendromus occidentalis]
MAKILPPQIIDEGSLQQGRVDCKNAPIVKPIVYGNEARYFGKKREGDGHTHEWKVYFKPWRNEDMSTWIKKVHFKLHESYENPNRIILAPPYEVAETGWGEFEIVIKVYFHDPNERPVTLYHVLKLFQTGNQVEQNSKKLVAETYDEIIFCEPTLQMHQLLTQPTVPLAGQAPALWKHETDLEEKRRRTLASIKSAQVKVRQEIAELKEKIMTTRESIELSAAQLQN